MRIPVACAGFGRFEGRTGLSPMTRFVHHFHRYSDLKVLVSSRVAGLCELPVGQFPGQARNDPRKSSNDVLFSLLIHKLKSRQWLRTEGVCPTFLPRPRLDTAQTRCCRKAAVASFQCSVNLGAGFARNPKWPSRSAVMSICQSTFINHERTPRSVPA